jgi:catechol 2,3-dioxygenase-like lactoylglutathione lyase family enzyme
MFDHVTIRVADGDASIRFFETVLAPLQIEQSSGGGDWAEWEDFSLAADGQPPTRGLHLAFVAPSREHVDAFWRTGVDAGHASDGEPGPRPQYGEDYYGAFLRDPDGNSVEAVHHRALRRGGHLDHLWIRVPDAERSARFYELVGGHAGFRRNPGTAGRAQFVGGKGGGSFSLVEEPGGLTEHVHLAFPVDANARVDAFHRALVAAGYADNGAPGERPQYHPGYYGAFVLDPDGHNVELVSHNRP